MQAASSAAMRSDTRQELSRASILLAEDEFMIALNIQIELEDQGATVTVVDSVEDGLKQDFSSFDAAILDVRLADGDVYPLADALREAGIEIVFHSGHAEVSTLTARYPGATALSKPAWAGTILGEVREPISR
jgi:DNA-binding response OmpR family regulator